MPTIDYYNPEQRPSYAMYYIRLSTQLLIFIGQVAALTFASELLPISATLFVIAVLLVGTLTFVLQRWNMLRHISSLQYDRPGREKRAKRELLASSLLCAFLTVWWLSALPRMWAVEQAPIGFP